MIVVNARFLTQPTTGVQRFAIELSLQLKELYGSKIIFIAPQKIVHQNTALRLEAQTTGTHSGHLWEQCDLPFYLKKHGNPLLLCLCNTAPLCYRNKIVTVHDVAFKAYPQTFSKSFLYAYRFMIPRVMRLSKKVITVSEFSKSEIVKYYGIDRNRISVVYNAVSDIFKPVADKMSGEKYLLAVSSLNYRKNFRSVLAAFNIFQKENKDINLYIIGDIKSASFRGIDIDYFRKNPRVKFLGRVSDNELIKYYSNAQAFLFPSLYEGFGIPVLEAQACACPVIAAKSSSLPEVLGESALFCDPASAEDFAHTILEVLNSTKLRKELIEKGKHNVERFSWQNSAKKISRILNQYTL